MGQLVDMFGNPIGGHSQNQKVKPITKAQAGAVITSEIDMGIETWNKAARVQFPDQEKKAHIFDISFNKFEYAEEAKAKSGLFGYAQLKIEVINDGKTVVIYDKGRNFTKEKELDNTNAYYPDMIIDCMGFLIASGLMYNLAISNPGNNVKKPKNAVNKSGNTAKG